MNYFIHNERDLGPLCWKWRWNVQPEKSVCHKTMDLSPAYVKSCRKFLEEISHKLQASSSKRHETDTIKK